MTNWNEVLRRATLLSTSALLTELARLAKTEPLEKLPTVTVYLTGAQALTGRVGAYEAGHSQKILLLLPLPDRYHTEQPFVYVDAGAIVAVSFDKATSEHALRIITAGKYSEAAGEGESEESN